MLSIFQNNNMLVALEEAEKAYKKKEIPVGCVIADQNGKIISKAHNLVEQKNNPNFHAEILAINIACDIIGSKNLSDYNLYVTLEPCTMCASAIANARIKKLYYGASDKKQGAVENGVRFYTSSSCFHKPEIYSHLMVDKSEKLLKNFFSSLRKNKK